MKSRNLCRGMYNNQYFCRSGHLRFDIFSLIFGDVIKEGIARLTNENTVNLHKRALHKKEQSIKEQEHNFVERL